MNDTVFTEAKKNSLSYPKKTFSNINFKKLSKFH